MLKNYPAFFINFTIYRKVKVVPTKSLYIIYLASYYR